MRALVATLGLLAVLTSGAWAQTDTTRVCIVKVSGMSCDACARTVEKAAKKVAGVKSAAVSRPTGEAEITYDPARTSPGAIAKRISDATGFKATAPKTEPPKKR